MIDFLAFKTAPPAIALQSALNVSIEFGNVILQRTPLISKVFLKFVFAQRMNRGDFVSQKQLFARVNLRRQVPVCVFPIHYEPNSEAASQNSANV